MSSITPQHNQIAVQLTQSKQRKRKRKKLQPHFHTNHAPPTQTAAAESMTALTLLIPVPNHPQSYGQPQSADPIPPAAIPQDRITEIVNAIPPLVARLNALREAYPHNAKKVHEEIQPAADTLLRLISTEISETGRAENKRAMEKLFENVTAIKYNRYQ